MKLFKHFIALALLTLTFQLYAQDPNEVVCAVLEENIVVPMPLADATALNLEIVDCAENGIDLEFLGGNDCDCDWDTEELICVSIEGFSDVLSIHPCEIECGFTDFFGEVEVVECGDLVFGCTDSSAINYDENATANDGSCEYDFGGDCDCDWGTDEFLCIDLGWGEIFEMHACELECFGNEFFGEEFEVVDCEDLVYGCTDMSATNFNEEANVNDGSCEYDWIDQCDCDWTSEEYVCINIVGTADVFTIHACDLECGYFILTPECVVVDCEELIFGCVDPDAINYDENATANDGSCEYDFGGDCDCDWESEEYVCVDFGWGEIIEIHACELECFGNEFFGDEIEIVDCGSLVYGCTDESAENYDENANVNDGSCEYDFGNDCDCDWESEEFVCVDFGWGEIIEIHACELECFGNEFFGDEIEIVDCGSLVYGCTDESAENYDENANVNDGSCEYDFGNDCDCDWESEEFVCVDFGWGEIMEIHACELECFGEEFLGDEIEIVDCDFETEENEDLEDDVLDAIDEFIGGGQFNQENFLDLADIIMELVLFPNPIGEEGMGVFVESNSESAAFIQITNSVGQVVLKENRQIQSGSNQFEIDVRGLESGIYTTTIFTPEGASVTERFIKK